MLNDDKLSTDGHRAKPWATFLDFWNLDCYGNWGQVTLASYKMKSSMSRKGDYWDNTPPESFWGRKKMGPFIRQEIRDAQAGHGRSY